MIFGLTKCLNRFYLLLFSHTPDISLGNSGAPQDCSVISGRCVERHKRLSWTHGIFCQKILNSLNGYPACHHAWYASCYSSNLTIKFHVYNPGGEQNEGDLNNDPDQPRLQSAWGKKVRSKNDFHMARPGDHLLIPFKCDRCIFVKLQKHLPDKTATKDQLLLACIRRMNLDAFWSRESSTVKSNARRVRKMIELSNLVGLSGPFYYNKTNLEHDHCGYEVAIEILLLSRRPGRYSKSYVQYDTLRTLRSTFSNFSKSTPDNNSDITSLGDFNGNFQRLVKDKCASLFFKRFMEGLKARMGQVCKPNLAMSIPLLKALIKNTEVKIEQSEDNEEQHMWLVFLNYVTISYTVSLRGPEGLLLDLNGLNRYWNTSNDYIIITLFGRIKGEKYDLLHKIPCTKTTQSGIKVNETLDHLMRAKRLLGQTIGPAISDYRGRILSTKTLDDMLHEVLRQIYSENPTLFPLSIDNEEKIHSNYQSFRTLRRTSTTRAVEKNVSISDINVVNKWATKEAAFGKKPKSSMHEHYAQFDLLINPFLRYTREM